MNTHDLPMTCCPECGKELDAATSLQSGTGPGPGDVTICMECQSILVFDDNMGLRWPTDEEMHDIAGDPRIVLAQRALAEVKAERPK